MGDYIFNVFMSMLGYIIPAVGIVIIARFFIKPAAKLLTDYESYIDNLSTYSRIRKGMYLVAAAILVFGAFVSFTGPQRTFTNTTFDHHADAAAVKERNQSATDGVDTTIEDNTRPPKFTDEERQDHFDNLSDWRSGSKTGE